LEYFPFCNLYRVTPPALNINHNIQSQVGDSFPPATAPHLDLRVEHHKSPLGMHPPTLPARLFSGERRNVSRSFFCVESRIRARDPDRPDPRVPGSSPRIIMVIAHHSSRPSCPVPRTDRSRYHNHTSLSPGTVRGGLLLHCTSSLTLTLCFSRSLIWTAYGLNRAQTLPGDNLGGMGAAQEHELRSTGATTSPGPSGLSGPLRVRRRHTANRHGDWVEDGMS
jgi:hypothetical protein